MTLCQITTRFALIMLWYYIHDICTLCLCFVLPWLWYAWTNFDNFWQNCYWGSKHNHKLHYFPSDRTCASTLHGETGNLEIASIYLNAACCFANKHTNTLKISPGHSWTTLHTQNDLLFAQTGLRKGASTLMLDVYQVCRGVSPCVKMGVTHQDWSESQLSVLLGYLTVSMNVRCY